MNDECEFAIPEDASYEELKVAVEAFHSYIHALEDELTSTRETAWSAGHVLLLLGKQLAASNRFGQRANAIRSVAGKMILIGIANQAMSKADVEKMQVDAAFDDIVSSLGEDDT